MAIPLAVPIAMTAAPLVASFFQKKPKGPDIGGELAKISALFAQMRAQAETNINRQAAQGRSASASNLAARGVYRAPVAEHTFNALEGERLNAIGSANAQLAGQEAGARSSLLSVLLGLNDQAQQRGQQANAARFGGITSIGANLLLAQLLRGGQPGAAGAAQTTAQNSPMQFPWASPEAYRWG